MQLKFKPGEETSVIEGLQAEVPGRPPSPPSLRSPRPWPIGQFNPAAQGLDSPSTSAASSFEGRQIQPPQAGYFGSGKTLGGLFWPRKTLGGLFWPRKNLGRAILAAENPGQAILAAEKPWAGYSSCGKTWAGAIFAAEKLCARAHSGNLRHRLCIFDT